MFFCCHHGCGYCSNNCWSIYLAPSQELIEVTGRLERAEDSNQKLVRDISDSCSKLENQTVIHEAHVKSEKRRRKLEEQIQDLQCREEVLKKDNSRLQSMNQSLISGLESHKAKIESEIKEVESKKWDSLLQERDKLKLELSGMDTLFQDEKTSHKFELSSVNIDLQQTREVKGLHKNVINLLLQCFVPLSSLCYEKVLSIFFPSFSTFSFFSSHPPPPILLFLPLPSSTPSHLPLSLLPPSTSSPSHPPHPHVSNSTVPKRTELSPVFVPM